MDVMAYAAAKSQGYDIANYDLNVVVTPRCSGIGWSGVGKREGQGGRGICTCFEYIYVCVFWY
jgi:hypothetical protein